MSVREEPFELVHLRDGRALGYLAVGRRDGPLVLHCHGSGSSRLEGLFFAEAADKLGVWVVAPDRPGIGRSDPWSYANPLSWAEDAVQLCDHLGAQRFAVQGLSNGGPYALACARALAGRVTACGLISTVSSPDLIIREGPLWMRALWRFARRHPRMFRAYIRMVVPDRALTVTAAERTIKATGRWMSRADRLAFGTPDARGLLARTLAEHRRQGSVGGRYEVEVGMRPWGFAPQEVTVPVRLWHGEDDRVMPVAPARALAALLPHCTSSFLPGEGHFSIVATRSVEILAAMTQRTRRA